MIFRTRIVGFHDRSEHKGSRDLGSKITLEREPENPYDSDAVRAFDKDGRSIGRVCRRHSAAVAAVLDNHGILITFIPNTAKESEFPSSIEINFVVKNLEQLPDAVTSLIRDLSFEAFCI